MSHQRLKVFGIHLLISMLIAFIVIMLVFYVWYPSPLHTAVGVTSIFLMLLAIDVILGPCLTLLVYKQGKKTLLMDLTVIAVLQLAALGYGLYSVAEGRPAWLVFSSPGFELVRVNEIDQRKTAQTPTEYRVPSWFGPQWAAAVEPTDKNESSDILFESVLAGLGSAQRPNLYQSLNSQKTLIQQSLLDLSALSANNPAEHIQAILTKHPQADSWMPLRANKQDMVVLMHKASAEVIAIVDLRPW